MDYKELRAAEYPPLADFADAFVHLSLGSTAEMEAYTAKCVAVKEKYWKDGTIHDPEEPAPENPEA